MTIRTFTDVEYKLRDIFNKLTDLGKRAIFNASLYYTKAEINDILTGKKQLNFTVALGNGSENTNAVQINSSPEIFLSLINFRRGIDVQGNSSFQNIITRNIVPETDNTYNIGTITPSQLVFAIIYAHIIRFVAPAIIADRPLRVNANKEIITSLINLADVTNTINPANVLGVAQGGTGQSSLTTGNVLLGNGTGPISSVAGFTGTVVLKGPTTDGSLTVQNGVITAAVDPT